MRVEAFILCEDIRQEAGNKKSLMGVYRDSIVVGAAAGAAPPTWPISMRLGVFARIRLTEGIALPDRYESRILIDGKPGVAIRGPVNIKDANKPIEMTLVAPQVMLPAPGTLSVEISFFAGEQLIERLADFSGSHLVVNAEPSTKSS